MSEAAASPEAPITPTVDRETRVGRVEAVLETLRHNANVHKDLVTTAVGATVGAALTGGNWEVGAMGGFVGSFARIAYNAVDENARRALAVAGEPVSRRIADSRHLAIVLVDAVRRRAVQLPQESEMNAESIHVDRIAKLSTPPKH